MSRRDPQPRHRRWRPKGDVLVVAELAGGHGREADRGADPAVHPLPLTDWSWPSRRTGRGPLRIHAEAATTNQTGVEMERLTRLQSGADRGTTWSRASKASRSARFVVSNRHVLPYPIRGSVRPLSRDVECRSLDEPVMARARIYHSSNRSDAPAWRGDPAGYRDAARSRTAACASPVATAGRRRR